MTGKYIKYTFCYVYYVGLVNLSIVRGRTGVNLPYNSCVSRWKIGVREVPDLVKVYRNFEVVFLIFRNPGRGDRPTDLINSILLCGHDKLAFQPETINTCDPSDDNA
jgi:hypothetical protein